MPPIITKSSGRVVFFSAVGRRADVPSCCLVVMSPRRHVAASPLGGISLLARSLAHAGEERGVTRGARAVCRHPDGRAGAAAASPARAS